MKISITDEMIRSSLRETPYWKELERQLNEHTKKSCFNLFIDYGDINFGSRVSLGKRLGVKDGSENDK